MTVKSWFNHQELVAPNCCHSVVLGLHKYFIQPQMLLQTGPVQRLFLRHYAPEVQAVATFFRHLRFDLD